MANAAKEAAALCALLANENRVLILCQLMDGPMNVSALHKGLREISQSALSQHLSLLRANRIVECDKCGQSMVYRVVDPRAVELTQTLKKVFHDSLLPGNKTEREQPKPVPQQTASEEEMNVP